MGTHKSSCRNFTNLLGLKRGDSVDAHGSVGGGSHIISGTNLLDVKNRPDKNMRLRWGVTCVRGGRT